MQHTPVRIGWMVVVLALLAGSATSVSPQKHAQAQAAPPASMYLATVAANNEAAEAPAQPTGWLIKDLGTLGGTSSFAYDINAREEVVGYSFLPDNGPAHAFVWTAADGMRDLGTLGGVFSDAQAINDAGQVAGTSSTTSGSDRATLWTPAYQLRFPLSAR